MRSPWRDFLVFLPFAMSSVTYAYFALAVFICVFVFTFLYSVYPYLTRSKVPMIRTPFSKKDVMKTVLVLGSGNFLEWYDFFPPSDPQTQLIQSWSVFAGAFLVRPLGGVLFGHVGDVHGREKALLFTILVMATPTLGIGLLPGYDSIGIAAPVVLIILRLLQGLAAGGELPGALIFAVESAPAKQRGLFGSLVQASSAGSLLSSAVAATLYYTLGAEAVNSWAWRVPFVLGAGIAIYVFCLRRSFMPTPIWLEAQPPPPPPEIELDAQSDAKAHRKSQASMPGAIAIAIAIGARGSSLAAASRRCFGRYVLRDARCCASCAPRPWAASATTRSSCGSLRTSPRAES
jgi:MFS family permease